MTTMRGPPPGRCWTGRRPGGRKTRHATWAPSPPAWKDDAGAEVRRLDQSLYAPGGVVWEGAALGNAFRATAVKQPVKPKAAAGGLAPLYPEWGKRLR